MDLEYIRQHNLVPKESIAAVLSHAILSAAEQQIGKSQTDSVVLNAKLTVTEMKATNCTQICIEVGHGQYICWHVG